MNSRRIVFLLAFLVFFISGIQIASAVPRSDSICETHPNFQQFPEVT